MSLKDKAYGAYIESQERSAQRRDESLAVMRKRTYQKLKDDFGVESPDIEWDSEGASHVCYGWVDGLHFRSKTDADSRVHLEWERKDRMEWLAADHMRELGRLITERRLYSETRAIERIIQPDVCQKEHRIESILVVDSAPKLRITCGDTMLDEIETSNDTSNLEVNLWRRLTMVTHERDALRLRLAPAAIGRSGEPEDHQSPGGSE